MKIVEWIEGVEAWDTSWHRPSRIASSHHWAIINLHIFIPILQYFAFVLLVNGQTTHASIGVNTESG